MCEFTLEHNGEVLTFSSEEELNSFLINNKNRLKLLDSSISLSKEYSKRDEVAAKIIAESKMAMTTKYDKYGNKITDVADYLSVTKAITDKNIFQENGKPFVVGFDVDEYMENQKALLENEIDPETGVKFTSEKIDENLKTLVKNWEKLAEMGTAIHAVAELYFSNPGISTDELIKKLIVNKDVSKITGIKKMLPELIQYVTNVETELRGRHGLESIIIPEAKIKAETPGTLNGKKGLVGKIDILVVDEKGDTHIYDFKASPYNFKDFKQVKTLTFDYQLGIYKSMLASKNIGTMNRGRVGIIPIMMKDVDFKHKTFSGIDNKVHIDYRDDLNDPRSSFNKGYFIENLNKLFPVTELAFEVSKERSEQLEKFDNEIFGYTKRVNVHKQSLENALKQRISKTSDGKFKVVHPDLKNTIKKYDTQEQAEEALRKSYEEYANDKGQRTRQIAENFRSAKLNNGYEGTGVGKTNRINKQFFAKYISAKYEIDDSLSDHNILVFYHPTKKLVEFVQITNNDLSVKVPMALGNKVTGNLVKDGSVDEYILPATSGNVDLLRLMMVANEYMGKLPKGDGWMIKNVQVVNTMTEQGAQQDLNVLKHNFKVLLDHGTNKKKLDLVNNFANGNIDTLSYYDSMLMDMDNIIGSENSYKDYIGYYRTQLQSIKPEDRVNMLKKLLNDLTNSTVQKNQTFTSPIARDTEIDRLYVSISKAIVELTKQYFIYGTEDIPQWSLHSDMFAPLDLSRNPIISEINKKVLMYTRNAIRSKLNPLLSKVEVVGEKYLRATGKLDTSLNAFDKFIEQNNEGPEPYLRIMNPENLHGPEKEYAEFFLEKINAIRYPNTKGDKNHSEAKLLMESGQWFDIPLMPGGFVNRGFSMEAMSQRFNDFKEEAMNVLMVQGENMKSKKEEQENLFNHFINPLRIGEGEDIDDRIQVLSSKGTNYFSRDLSEILASYIYSAVMEEEYNDIIPIVKASVISAVANNEFNNIVADDMEKMLMEQMQSRIYEKEHISKNLRGVHLGLRALSKFSTNATLAMNPASWIRETLQGSKGNVYRVISKFTGKDGPKIEDLAKGYAFVTKHGPSSLVNDTIIQGFDKLYGIAGQGMSETKEAHRANRNNFLNGMCKSGTMMAVNRMPDYMNRMALFLSFVYKEGVLDAFEFKDKELIYNFEKDPRFKGVAEYFKGKGPKPSGEAISKYEIMRAEFNATPGMEQIKPGDPLPSAFTVKQIESIRSMSNQIHGHMDSNTQMHFKRYLMGKIMLKFQTYLGAKVLNYTLAEGQYNRYENRYKVDPATGKDVYITMSKDPETGEWIPGETTDYSHPDCIKERALENFTRMEEGIAYSIWEGLKIVFNPENRDLNLANLKENDARMANIKFFVADLFSMASIIAILAAFGLSGFSDDDDEGTKLQRDLAKIVKGVAIEDSPLTLVNTVSRFVNSPDLSIATKHVKNSMNVVVNPEFHANEWFQGFGFGKAVKYISE